MAYFHCLIGGGSSGGGYELTVTCDAAFAGTTITCTDGVTTLTQTCPSASPYEVVFEIPNGGDWTISGVVGGHTVSTGVNIPTSAELIATIPQTVTIYSAKEDTISYTDIDGATQTITFASGATSKEVTIAINASGSSITFTSSVAKNPNNLSQYYSKTFTITPSTTDIYLMPDAVKTLYWWGYNGGVESAIPANGWNHSATLVGCEFQTNKVYLNSTSSSTLSIVGSTDAHQFTKTHYILDGIDTTGNGFYSTYSNKNLIASGAQQDYAVIPTSVEHKVLTAVNVTNGYLGAQVIRSAKANLYALWYE